MLYPGGRESQAPPPSSTRPASPKRPPPVSSKPNLSMKSTLHASLILLSALGLNPNSTLAQEAKATSNPTQPSQSGATEAAEKPLVAKQEPDTQKLSWPRDKSRVVCSVDGKDHSLTDLITYVNSRHYPGLLAQLDTPPGNALLQSPLPAAWVRQYADVLALRAEAVYRKIEMKAAENELSNALRATFEPYLKQYIENRKKRGITAPISQRTVNLKLADFQSRRGLETEVGGWLNTLVKAVDPKQNDEYLTAFYRDHAQWFGGRIDIATIFIRNRDSRTLELLQGEALKESKQKIADVRKRLKPDASNFAELAQRYSEDRRTARDGGALRQLTRFDPRLPAVLVRTAWYMTDKQVVGPIESPFGQHFIKRLSYKHVYYIATPMEIRPQIADAVRKDEQETLLIELRKRRNVVLKY